MNKLAAFSRCIDKLNDSLGRAVSFLVVPMIVIMVLEVVAPLLLHRPDDLGA